MAEATLFAGPSAHGIDRRLLRGIRLRPPVRRGDLPQLLAERAPPGVLLLCDGVFQSQPAVGHAEIRALLDDGWTVWGVSSIGAIRAFEMQTLGVRGFGYVYAQFHRHADFTDDELCLLHAPMRPYMPLTEALVNVRWALETAGAALGVDRASGQALVAGLGQLWFGDRTAARMQQLMVQECGIAPAAATALLQWLPANRVKNRDLAELLRTRPWRAAASAQAVGKASTSISATGEAAP